MKGIVSILLLSFTLSAFSATEVTLMTYNLENLFDDRHDDGKKDWTYLPMAFKKKSEEAQAYCEGLRSPYYKKNCLEFDWTKKVIIKKIKNLAKMIKYQYKTAPDFLVLQEVENYRVLKWLNKYGKLKYKEIVLIEGPDKRGIDVAILSKYPLVSQKLHPIILKGLIATGKKAKQTRGVLEAVFNVHGKKVAVLANHWPSQMNSDESRLIAARTMATVAGKIEDAAVVALGDFNTMESDHPHGINTYLLSPWRTINFFDAHKEFLKETGYSHTKPFGSHFYKEWAHLDRIFFMNKTTETKKRNCYADNCLIPIWDSYKIVAPRFALTDYTYTDSNGEIVEYKNIPHRYDAAKGQGYSDHLPVTIKAIIR